ncbi:PepSY domain-containing protein [Roseovarius aestuarii]|uniref:PepSY domain-containing protein n=1 Tax=Roseovarius aestuarii TaxID=475083 RepID=A0A1X7BNT3_9RHOB|nr:PepSY domain-containing protein [Roseovarius aestuarii]SMC11214.1 hypothetical protein ROA7745_01025 [Roseovarius aestuarii]
MLINRVTHTAFIVSVIFVGLAVTAASAASDEDKVDTEFSYQEMLDVPVKFGQAMTIARENAEGQIVEITLDEFNDTQVYLASLANATSLSELMINAQDGTIMGTNVQTAATPDLMEELIEREIEDAVEFADVMGDMMEFGMFGLMSDFDEMTCGPDTYEN